MSELNLDNWTNPQAHVPVHPATDVGLDAVAASFTRATHDAGLDFGRDHVEIAATLIAALATKPFVIFSGLSGAGKTQLATALGQWFGRERLLVQPVRPNWTSPEAVLGFENPESESHDSMHTWNVPRVLEFILAALRDHDEPYLLVLDEMNLAHVEQYFADVLSGMESNQPVVPNLRHDGSGWRLPRKDMRYAPWPKNLFLIGTVNVDETTYRFSPKVLDRASCIEFRVPPGALKTRYPKQGAVEKGDRVLQHAFLQRSQGPEPEWNKRDHLAVGLQHLHRFLYEYDAEFGHRVFRESLRFGAMMADTGMNDVKLALDLIVLFKILPKIEMAPIREIEILQALAGFALYGPGRAVEIDPLVRHETEPVLPRTYAKIRRIARSVTN